MALHLFQSDVAKLLQVDKGSVQNWERNVYRPNDQVLPRIHAFLGYLP
jgi:DNA-binding transcriptional regulator YiaG